MGYCDEPVVEALWIAAGFGVVSLTWFGTARNCQTAREAKEELAHIPGETVKKLVDGDTLERIIRSKQSAVEKVENTKRYVVAVNAFKLVDEAIRYLENNKLAFPRRLNPAIRVPIPWDQTPEATMARAYKEVFGNRLKALVEEFKEPGIKLPQKEKLTSTQACIVG